MTSRVCHYFATKRVQGHDLRYRTESGASLLIADDDPYDVLHSAQLNAHSLSAGPAGR